MASAFPTQRSVGQVLRQHTPGALIYIEEHGLVGRIRQIIGEPDSNVVNQRRLHQQVVRLLHRWSDYQISIDGEKGDDKDSEPMSRGMIRNIALPDELRVQDIVAIAPKTVIWEPYPHLYQCATKDCLVLADPRSSNFKGKCRRCGGALEQMKYIRFHPCGEIDYLKPSREDICQTHNLTYFMDRGRFTTSSWKCRGEDCTFEKKYSFQPCPHLQCRKQNPNRPLFQESLWNDQWVHFSQVIDYVNLNDSLMDKFLGSARGKELIHLGVLGGIPAGEKRLLRTLEQESNCPKCQSSVPAGAKYCPECGAPIPQELQVDGTTKAVAQMVDAEANRCIWALLRDSESSLSLRDKVQQGANESASFVWALKQAKQAGVYDIVLVDSFPMITAAVGYTRDRSGPPAWFRAFDPLDDQKQRTPIYTQSSETEAWMVQLNATDIARWLIANAIEPFATVLRDKLLEEAQLKEWFIERIARPDEESSGDDVRLRGIVFGLLHSFSHVLLLSLATHSGLDATSLGELIFTDALAFALHTGDSDLGALTAAFEQLAGVVLTNAAEEFIACKFDPTCTTDDGGSCVGCIQLYRGCQEFNHNLSRAFLFGGPTGQLAPGIIREGYFAVAAGQA